MSLAKTFQLCYITDRHALKPQELLRRISDAARAGVDLIQIREKDLETRELLELSRDALEAARTAKTRVVINDRMDIALAEDAAGVHLSRESLPAAEVRCVVSKDFLIGVSCHSLQEALEAEAARADYVLLGPIFATPSKLRYGPSLGIQILREATSQLKIPVLALGGITVERARECRAAGAAGIAAIRLFQEAASIEELVLELRA
jgi:thiamine-phosphate pyrophosphorylase